MFNKTFAPYNVIGLPEIKDEEPNSDVVSTPGMRMQAKVEAASDYPIKEFHTKKVVYGQKDIEV